MPEIRVHLLPGQIPPERDLANSCCVVIDVLRATTSMVVALDSKVLSIRPFESIDEAREFAEAHNYLLAGERQGMKIAGFDLGNSPPEFAQEKVAGRRLAMTTTNGTRALLACRDARRAIVAAFANLSAVCELLQGESEVDIVCAGTDGEVTLEDVLLAGAISSRFDPSNYQNYEARLSVDLWRLHHSHLKAAFLISQGGKNLVRISRQSDIEFAARVDHCRCIPILREGELQLEQT
jgi:2-phosphosulfolactate phosphatase